MLSAANTPFFCFTGQFRGCKLPDSVREPEGCPYNANPKKELNHATFNNTILKNQQVNGFFGNSRTSTTGLSTGSMSIWDAMRRLRMQKDFKPI